MDPDEWKGGKRMGAGILEYTDEWEEEDRTMGMTEDAVTFEIFRKMANGLKKKKLTV